MRSLRRSERKSEPGESILPHSANILYLQLRGS